MKNREEAIAIWKKYNSDDSLLRHAFSVEAAMRHFAKKHGEDPDYWAMVGLLHDIDYEKYPEEHLKHAGKMLEEHGFDEAFIRAVESHGWGIVNNIEPKHIMEKVLYAVDELTGFIAACAFVRPSRSVLDMETKSVKKKWKTLAFAAGVNREVIEKGSSLLNMDLDELIGETIMALREEAEACGLKGSL